MQIIKPLFSIINAYTALGLYLFSKKKKDIWLIGGHAGNLYTDNAKVFYEYILEEHPHINIYWIVNKDAPHIDKIKGNKLIKGSIKSYHYFYHSKVILFSDTLNSDIAPFSFVLPIVRMFYNKTQKVYLGHGTISFKKMPTFTGIKQIIKTKIFQSYDLAIAATELEVRVMAENYGIKKSAIALAGSARNDKLINQISTPDIILIAPTWRTWIKGSETLKNTTFFHHYKALLTDKKLYDFLEKHNTYIHFYLHHMFHKYIDEFTLLQNKYIHILHKDADISKEITSSHMLITDYSSICSDFYYLKKPVLFYQFDKKEYLEKVGSEIDLNNTIFGSITYNKKSLLKNLFLTIHRNYEVTLMQEEGNKFFNYFKDTNNCKRIFNEIMKRRYSKG